MSFRLRTLFIAIAILSMPLAWVVNTFRPKAIFERFTGVSLPDSAIILENATVETGPFGSDSYRCIIVQIDTETISKWLDMPPLKGAAEWKRGPVSGAVLRAKNTVPNDILESNAIQYALDIYRQGHGYLIVLDPRSAKAWLLMW